MEELLKEILSEIKLLRQDVRKEQVDTCSAQEALELLGLGNPAYLKYYHLLEYLQRRETGKNSYTYYKSECRQLADKIKRGDVKVPTVREAAAYKK